MPALDFTGFPSKPAAPPAVSPGAPRPTARTGAPKAGPKTGAKAGSPGAADGEFGSLVDRFADAPEEGKAASAGGSTRRSREIVTDGEERAAEPRVKKGDADEVGGTANDAPASFAASNPTAFPWTLPLNPSLWNIETVQVDGQVDGESAGETGEAIGSDSVIGAATTAIVDGAAGACVATLPGAGAEMSAAFTVPVPTPIAVDPAAATATATTAAASAVSAAESQGATDESAIDAIDAFAWNGAASGAGSVATATGTDATEAGGDLLASTIIAGAGQASAAFTGGSIDSFGVDSTIGQSAASALTNIQFEDSSSVDPNDSALLAQSAMDAATMAAAVEESTATTAADRTGQSNAAIDGPLSGDPAREQALIELQSALDSARANAPSAAVRHTANADAPFVIQTGTQAGSIASDDAAAAANAAAIEASAAAAASAANDDGSGITLTTTGETGAAGAGAGAIASASSNRSREGKQASEDSSAAGDQSIAGASSWAVAALAKYAEAAGEGESSGSDSRDGGSHSAVAEIASAGRAGGDAGHVAGIGFDARVIAATRAENVAASEHAGAGGWAGESAILTTAAPEDQAAQIVRSMRLQWRGTTGEATLRLQPDHLGPVFVSVRVEQGTVSATVRAETPAAQQWIQQHQQQLRDALDAQGLRVAQFHVTSNPDDRPRRDHDQEQHQDAAGRRSRPRTRNTDAGDRTFEIHL